MYEAYVAFAFRDRVVTEDELDTLRALQRLLLLDEALIQRAYWDPILEMYGRQVDQLIADGRLTAEGRVALSKLKTDLRIPEEQAKRVYDARTGKRVEDFVAEIIEDKKVSPEEERELHAMCESLDVKINWSGDSGETFARFRENWQLEHGQLTEIDVPINIQKKEACYAVREVEWYETRRVTKRIGYSGPTARLRIMKGVYWRVGSIGVQPVSEDVMAHIDSGTVYLTNKRIIFIGETSNKTIRLSRILDYEVYTNGITLQKDAGKSPFLEFTDRPEQFGVLLGRMINEGS
ncbi:MAG TPA: hypothetical protein VEK15_17805, partial [Vicinamibacteria bacterium]|nr:hypothetical protein [Vicinamibacteria bacterium]